jgi:hypothetical protein
MVSFFFKFDRINGIFWMNVLGAFQMKATHPNRPSAEWRITQGNPVNPV